MHCLLKHNPTSKTLKQLKNTRLKLLKTNAAIWFNKMCRIKQLKPNYIDIIIKGNKPQDRKTTINEVRYRLNQEIKFLYCKKQNLNHQLYNIQFKCMHCSNGMWQHMQSSIDSQVNDFMDKTYQTQQKIGLINKAETDGTQHHTKKHTHSFQESWTYPI